MYNLDCILMYETNRKKFSDTYFAKAHIKDKLRKEVAEISYKFKKYQRCVTNHRLFSISTILFYLLKIPYISLDPSKPDFIEKLFQKLSINELLGIGNLLDYTELNKYILSGSYPNDLALAIEKELNASSKAREIHGNSINYEDLSIQKLVDLYSQKKEFNESTSNVSTISSCPEYIIDELYDKGYYVLEEFISAEYLLALQTRTKDLCIKESDNFTNSGGFFYGENKRKQRLFNLLPKDSVYLNLLSCPFLRNLCCRYFYRATNHDSYGLNSFSAHLIHSSGTAGPWHIDTPVSQPLPTEFPLKLQLVITLDAFSPINGSTAIIPGSHKSGKKPIHKDINSSESIIVNCKPGSLILFNSSIYHRNTNNKTENSRNALLASFVPSYFMDIGGYQLKPTSGTGNFNYPSEAMMDVILFGLGSFLFDLIRVNSEN